MSPAQQRDHRVTPKTQQLVGGFHRLEKALLFASSLLSQFVGSLHDVQPGSNGVSTMSGFQDGGRRNGSTLGNG